MRITNILHGFGFRFLIHQIAKNGNVSPGSKASSKSNPSTPVTPTSPLSKLPGEVDDTTGSITSNGAVPKTNGSIKSDTNKEGKVEKGNTYDDDNITDNHDTSIINPSPASSSPENKKVVDELTPEMTKTEIETTTAPLPQQTVNGVDKVGASAASPAANNSNAESTANSVIEPTTASAPPALPDSSSTTNPVVVDDASSDKPPAPAPTVNGTSKDAETADKQSATTTTPTSPEREEPGT